MCFKDRSRMVWLVWSFYVVKNGDEVGEIVGVILKRDFEGSK